MVSWKGSIKMFKSRRDYDIQECEETIRILRDESLGLGDKDIHNLELILY